MKRDDILRMAREAKLPDPMVFYASIERFAALVAAAEREACAKICTGRTGGAMQSNDWWEGFKIATNQCAAAIRARGQQ